MKALTSTTSSSKAIADRLLPPSSSVLETPHQLCFSNGFKASNFKLLSLVNYKGLYPLLAVPSENQVELETDESQAQQSEQTNVLKHVRVSFQLQKDCNFGEHFLLVGDDPMLGSWDPLEALPMTWSDGHVWAVELDVPAGKSIQFKFILKGKEGIIWQPGSDRVIHTWETMNRITVREDWENAELQKITEEDQLAQSNEESQVVPEVSSFAEKVDTPQKEVEFNVSKISQIVDSRTREEEKLLTEPVQEQITGNNNSPSTEKPMTIVAENIGSSEDLTKSASREKSERNTVQGNGEFENSPRIDGATREHGHNGNKESLKKQEIEGTPIMDENFPDYQGEPVLIPGLPQPVDGEGPTEVQDSTTTETLIGAFETRDQNAPEFSEEEKSDDDAPLEINATINDEPELDENEYEEEQSHSAPEMEDVSNSEQVYGNPLQNDIQWGRETVKKFLTKLGFLL